MCPCTHISVHMWLKVMLSISSNSLKIKVLYFQNGKYLWELSEHFSWTIKVPLFMFPQMPSEPLQMLTIYHKGAKLSMEVYQHKSVHLSTLQSDSPWQWVSSRNSPSKDHSPTWYGVLFLPLKAIEKSCLKFHWG